MELTPQQERDFMEGCREVAERVRQGDDYRRFYELPPAEVIRAQRIQESLEERL
jgi:hypothetical protein